MADMRDRLIELLLKELECDKNGNGNCEMCECKYTDKECVKYLSRIFADHLLANGVILVKRGRWVEGKTLERCSACGKKGFSDWHYCPNCGAKMDGGKDETK